MYKSIFLENDKGIKSIEKRKRPEMTEEQKDKLRQRFQERRKLNEAVDVQDIIKELINTGWAGSNKEQMKAVQLLKGLATSDEPASNKFMKKLDTFTSGLKVEDFK